MIKPKKLKRGDTVALVSLSSGLGGEPLFTHRVEQGVRRLENVFGLKTIIMPNAMKGIEYLDNNPQARAEDLMDAFQNPSISAVITMIGGDDTIRLLPYIDFNIIRNNPKIFMGYSDTTVNHFMMYKAGITSFYGPAIMSEFAENVKMHEYTRKFIEKILFGNENVVEISASYEWTSEILDWGNAENDKIQRKMIQDSKGYELLQGNKTVQGKLIGGCIDVFPMIIGTQLWPAADAWKDSILFLETSEECPDPNVIKFILRGLAAQGILNEISGIIVAKPYQEKYYEEYKEVLKQVVGKEAGRRDLPILYNMNFGHNAPITILPYGIMAEISCEKREFRLLESSVK